MTSGSWGIRSRGWHSTETGKEASLALMTRWSNTVLILSVGIGYDSDHPLRPWPQFSLAPLPTHPNFPYVNISCCGLWIGITYGTLTSSRSK